MIKKLPSKTQIRSFIANFSLDGINALLATVLYGISVLRINQIRTFGWIDCLCSRYASFYGYFHGQKKYTTDISYVRL